MSKPPRRKRGRAAWVRRSVQLAFLAIFLALLLLAQPVPGERPAPWLDAFFRIDPLILLSTSIAAREVLWGLMFALITVGVAILLGRVFCGWVCPLGTVHAVAGRVFDFWRPRRRKEHYSRWQLSKYVILVGLLVMAATGTVWLALFDPIVILYRSTTTALLPLFQGAVEDTSTAVYQTDPNIGGWPLKNVTEPPYEFLRDNTFVTPRQAFLGAGFVLGFFLLTVALNYWRRRFWCRYLCPLGGLLGVLSWRPWITRKVDSEACNQCDVCGLTCHGAASGAPGTAWKPQECLGCMNCTDACPPGGLSFRPSLPWQRPESEEPIDLSRRHLLGGALLGATGVAFFRLSPQARGKTFEPALIRPPGAGTEADFLSRCTACGLCMKICPTGGLQPALSDAGLAGLWTPQLVPRIGYCDYECNRCGEVCPTGAIAALPVEEKKSTKIGLAAIDATRCIPYAYGRDCMVCEEHCPVPDKAIYFVATEVTLRDGQPRELLQPRVDADKCIGCGICENVCPFKDKPAIRVTSANESRHRDNQPILPGFGPYGYG